MLFVDEKSFLCEIDLNAMDTELNWGQHETSRIPNSPQSGLNFVSIEARLSSVASKGRDS